MEQYAGLEEWKSRRPCPSRFEFYTEAFKTWEARWHFYDEWCVSLFISLCMIWHGNYRPSFRQNRPSQLFLLYSLYPSYRSRKLEQDGKSACEEEPEQFDFHHVGWNPTLTAWAETERAIRADFEKRLA